MLGPTHLSFVPARLGLVISKQIGGGILRHSLAKRFHLGLQGRGTPTKGTACFARVLLHTAAPLCCPASPPALLLLPPPCALPPASVALLAASPSPWLLFGVRATRTASTARNSGRSTAGPFPPHAARFSGAAVRFPVRLAVHSLRVAGTAHRGRAGPPARLGDPSATSTRSFQGLHPLLRLPGCMRHHSLSWSQRHRALAGVVLGPHVATVLIWLVILAIVALTTVSLLP